MRSAGRMASRTTTCVEANCSSKILASSTVLGQVVVSVTEKHHVMRATTLLTAYLESVQMLVKHMCTQATSTATSGASAGSLSVKFTDVAKSGCVRLQLRMPQRSSCP